MASRRVVLMMPTCKVRVPLLDHCEAGAGATAAALIALEPTRLQQADSLEELQPGFT